MFLFGLSLLGMATAPHVQAKSCADKGTSGHGEGGAKLGYPTFCSIPKAPTHLRAPADFRAAVLDTRRAGQAMVRASAPDSFELPLDGAAIFASQGRHAAAPPPPMNPQDEAEAEAFAREARGRATPPARPH